MSRKNPIPNKDKEDSKQIAHKTITKKSTKKPLLGEKTSNTKKKRKTGSNVKYFTHNGHALTPNEAKFIGLYVEYGNATKAVQEAGYVTKNPRGYGSLLLTKQHIADEIKYRLEQLESAKIADAEEILKYFTSVMRGEIQDQFGLEAPLSERTKAAQELAKRKIDIPNKLNGKETAEVRITLDWSEMKEDDDETK